MQVKTGIYYGDDVDSLPLGSAKNIKKDESDICITYSASTSCGDINCQFYKTNNEFRCVVVENNRIHRSKNAKQDFETIQLMYERQKADYAKLYQGIKAEDLAKLAQDEFHAMQ